MSTRDHELEYTGDDPELRAYFSGPGRYAIIARKVDLSIKLSDRGCAGGTCDLDSPCRRHKLIPAVVARYLRMEARAR